MSQPVKVERNTNEEEEPPPPHAKVDRKRKVKEEEPPPHAKVDRKRKVKEEEPTTPPPPAKVERKEKVKEEEEQPPPPVKVERNVKKNEEPPPATVEPKVKEESTPMSKAGGDGSHINIKVKTYMISMLEEMFFRINRHTKMQRLMDLYCDRQSIERHGFTFFAHDRRIRGEKTPDEIGLQDGDEIVALLHQYGS